MELQQNFHTKFLSCNSKGIVYKVVLLSKSIMLSSYAAVSLVSHLMLSGEHWVTPVKLQGKFQQILRTNLRTHGYIQ